MFDVAITQLSDRTALDAALAEADVAPLLMVLVHLTGEDHWLDEIGPHIVGAWNFMEQVPAGNKAALRARLATVLSELAAGQRRLPDRPPLDLIPRMMKAGVGGTVPDEYIPLILEEMNLADGEPHDAYNERVDEAHAKTVWADGGVGNWYKNARGRVIANSPWRLVDYWAMTREFDPAEFIAQPALPQA